MDYPKFIVSNQKEESICIQRVNNISQVVASLIPARSHTFMEIDHEIISIAILLPSTDSRRVVASYKQKFMHVVLVNCIVKLAQEKSVVR